MRSEGAAPSSVKGCTYGALEMMETLPLGLPPKATDGVSLCDARPGMLVGDCWTHICRKNSWSNRALALIDSAMEKHYQRGAYISKSMIPYMDKLQPQKPLSNLRKIELQTFLGWYTKACAQTCALFVEAAG